MLGCTDRNPVVATIDTFEAHVKTCTALSLVRVPPKAACGVLETPYSTLQGFLAPMRTLVCSSRGRVWPIHRHEACVYGHMLRFSQRLASCDMTRHHLRRVGQCALCAFMSPYAPGNYLHRPMIHPVRCWCQKCTSYWWMAQFGRSCTWTIQKRRAATKWICGGRESVTGCMS